MILADSIVQVRLIKQSITRTESKKLFGLSEFNPLLRSMLVEWLLTLFLHNALDRHQNFQAR
jgi:hypothetical protein